MTSPGITEFLLARIADDEAVARRGVGWADRSTRWGRVLAECDAKRRIVDDHNVVHDGCPGSPTRVSGEGEQDGSYGGPCAVLRNLALPYADHPDYNPVWRP